MALIASYKNRGQLEQLLVRYQDWLSKDEIKEVRMLGSVLKFIHALNISKRQIIQDVVLKNLEDVVEITFTTTQLAAAESYAAERQKKHIERVFKKPVTLVFQ